MKLSAAADLAPGFVIRAQRGSALVTGLVFLVAIIMLGLSASTSSIQQEMGMRSIRDRTVALEAAYAALRAGETFLRNNNGPLTPNFGPNGNSAIRAQGFCLPAINNCAMADAGFWTTNGQELGNDDPTPALNFVAAQPRYIIELILCPNQNCTGPPSGWPRFYRITARGVGLNANTVHVVSSINRF